MSDSSLAARTFNSNKISDVLVELSTTALAGVRHVRLTSTPGDDLVEEDFADRVRNLLQPMIGLVSLTICIPSMARLHPSNSLPKVLDVLRSTSALRPQCRLGLAVHESEQAWSALTILNRIVEWRLRLHTIEFTRAFFPVEALIQAAQACGLASLTLHATQVFSSSLPSDVTAAMTHDPREEVPSIPTLTSLTALSHSENSPGLDLLLHTAAKTLMHLDMSSSSSGKGVMLRGREFPYLARLSMHEDLLPEMTDARMPKLQEVIVPALTRVESSGALEEMLQSSGPQVQKVRVSRVVAGDVSEALTRLEETYASVRLTIGELAVREPARLTPAALAISEHLINQGPPIAEDWPLGFEKRGYPLLRSVVLKLHEGCNYVEFITSLDAPNMDSPPSISLIAKKKNKGKAHKK